MPAALIPALALALSGCQTMLSATSTAQSQAAQTRPSMIAAKAALQEGEASTALGIARGVLSMEPHNVAALVAAGDADNAIGNHRAAEKDYRTALQVEPGNVPAQLGLAKIAMRDDAKAAEQQFRQILAHSPNNAAVLTDLGVSLDLQERHKEAQAVYAQAMAINNDMTSTRVDMAVSLALSGEPMKAEDMLHDATESGVMPPKVRADFALAQVLSGHAQEAQATLQADLSAEEAKSSVEGMEALMPKK